MRSRRRRRLASIVATIVVLVALVYLVAFSPWLRVRTVQVQGIERASSDQISALTNTQLDQPLALVDVRKVAASVAAVPPVRRVDVSRRWPSTLRVTVHERVPVAVLPQGREFQLVDGEGVVVESGSTRPTDLPILEVDLGAAGASAMRSALVVQEGLDPTIAAVVRQLGATSPDGVYLVLSNGAHVVWGDDSRIPVKNDALMALVRAQPSAAKYDVSAPTAPAVSQSTVSEPLELSTTTGGVPSGAASP